MLDWLEKNGTYQREIDSLLLRVLYTVYDLFPFSFQNSSRVENRLENLQWDFLWSRMDVEFKFIWWVGNLFCSPFKIGEQGVGDEEA